MKKQWISVKCGLSRDPKHRQRMGESVWLFLHMLDIATWEDGIVHDWKDEAAAEEMEMPVRTLREHRRKLAELDYITCNQKQYTQDIVIHNWTNPREYGGKVYNQKQGYSDMEPEGDTQGYIQGSRKDVTPTLDSKNQISKATSFRPQTIEQAIFANQPVTADLLTDDTPLHEFERIFGFGQLPWNSTGVWDKFAKFIRQQYAAGWFADYVKWREGDGKYDAYSNRKIRENPQAFMDTGYPAYEAKKMYRKTDEVRPEYIPYKPEEGNYVPRPKN